jgi:hypothetical protein
MTQIPRARYITRRAWLVLTALPLMAFMIVRYFVSLSSIAGHYSWTAPPVDSWCGNSYYQLRLSKRGYGLIEYTEPNGRSWAASLDWTTFQGHLELTIHRNGADGSSYLMAEGVHRCNWTPGVIQILGVTRSGGFQDYGSGRPIRFTRNFF